MREPDFFIVGAPKCGTTALSEYLKNHGEVFVTEPKEPHYFALDLPEYRFVTTPQGYQGLFSKSGVHHRAFGEASVYYLYSDCAIGEINKSYPLAKFLVLLRNPIELAQSMHAQALRSRDEDVTDFALAWSLCDARRQGEEIPKSCRNIKILLYDEIACLGSQLERLLERIPASRVRWWFFDDFCKNPGTVYREVLEFLGVQDDGRSEFPRINERRVARYQWLAQFTQKTPPALVDAAIFLRKMLGIERWGILDRLRAANFVRPKSNDTPSAVIDEMARHFADDIALLSEKTGRDLRTWLPGGQ